MNSASKLATLIAGITLMTHAAVAASPAPSSDPRIDPQVQAFLTELNRDSSPFWELPQPKPQEILTSLQNKTPVDMSGVTHAVGTIVGQGITGESVTTAAGLRIWTGKAGDPFWIEPDVLHAVGHAFQDGTVIDLSGWHPSQAKNLFAGHTVHSIVLEVPDRELLAPVSDKRRIGVWAVATLATDAGGWRSINRVGLPMIHPLFTQYNEDLGNSLNAGRPADDFATYGSVVAKAIAGVVAATGTAENPAAYGEKVAHRFFPNILPYVVGTPAVFGFAEWNGRSLTDNAPDVMFSIAANAPIHLGIGKESVTSTPSTTFPYVPVAT